MTARRYNTGEMIGKYQVLRVIGAGGMGTVYDVEDTKIGKRYALKTVNPELANREDLGRRMEREARILARIAHSNIVDIVTADVSNDQWRVPYYVMERLTGQTLRMMLEKRHRLDVAHAVHLTIDLLDALGHAHNEGVVHRDVKPENIFIHRPPNGFTVTKLLDFGIMSLLSSDQRETAGRFLGTFRYAAPEQLQGAAPSPLFDVYATGLVLYEAISGRGPFDDAGDGHAVASARLQRPAPLLSTFVPEVPPELDQLLRQVLARDPARRTNSAYTFRTQLRTIKAKLRGVDSPPEWTENRPTSPDFLSSPPGVGPGTAKMVEMQNVQGQLVVSPVGSPVTPMVVGAESTARPMVAPGAGQGAASQGPPAELLAQTSRDAVDRGAQTNTRQPSTPRMVREGENATEAFLLVTPGGAGAAPAEAQVPTTPMAAPDSFRWPPERPAATSEEPQIQTLTSDAARRRSGAPLAAALLGVLGLAMVGTIVFAVRHGLGRSGGAATTETASPSVLAAPPPAASVVALPAPVLAPPGLDDTTPQGSPSVSASALPVASASVPPSPTAQPRAPAAWRSVTGPATATATATPPPSPPSSAAPHRVGPGF